MEGANKHAHRWGCNHKIYFCLECGTVRDKDQGEFAFPSTKVDILFPSEDRERDERFEHAPLGPKGYN